MTFGVLKNLIQLKFKDVIGLVKATPHLLKFVDLVDLVRDHDEEVDYKEYVLESFPDDYQISFSSICASPSDTDYERESMKKTYKKRFKRDIVQDILGLETFIKNALDSDRNKGVEISPNTYQSYKKILETIDGIKYLFVPSFDQQTMTVAQIKALPPENARHDFYHEEDDDLNGLQDEVPRF
jgi:hypothetical protein